MFRDFINHGNNSEDRISAFIEHYGYKLLGAGREENRVFEIDENLDLLEESCEHFPNLICLGYTKSRL